MKKSKIILSLSLLVGLSWCFVALADEGDNPAPLQAVPATAAVQVPAPGAQLQDDAYSYNPLGKPDPFKPFINIDVRPMAKEKEKKIESIFPLQRASVESFTLVGVIGDAVRRVAIVEDAGRRFYPLFLGTHIGLNNGKVSGILADRVTVDEPDGKKVKRIILKLRKNI
ncbi:MAG TPA: pilus assembly protein PilP [Smithellaceae bacterium]|nr:pilus assembly protein PilP [Smithellaceae bacterium]HQF83807.1 pilus assembly protein PilP [Smithellaceae bacterium]HQG80049.1 pilus assembly protein PilP [Smithellaceae bacterium]